MFASRSRCLNSRSLVLSLSLLSVMAIAGCGGGPGSTSSNTGSGTGSPKTLTSIAASPAQASIAVKGTEQFSATATYSDGSTADVTASATWTDTNASVATISGKGMVTALAPGSTTITASMQGLSGSATLNVAAAPKTLTSIAVTPASPGILVGATQQFAAIATYSDSSTADVTGTVAWSSSNQAAATITATGLATAVAAGSTTITAALNGVNGTSNLNVSAPGPTLSSISVSAAATSIDVGSTDQFTATATYSDGSTQNVTVTAVWKSSNTADASIDSAGLATAISAGSTTITASLNGVTGSASLTVTGITSIAVSATTASISVGSTDQFTATATYSDGTKQNITATATWKSSNPAFATINSSGLATAVSAGSPTISASLNGVTGSTTLTVTGITSISVAPASPSFAVGSTQQFTATAKYSDNSTADISSTANWSVGNTSVATIAAGGVVTGVASGYTAVSASLQGKTGSTTAAVTVAAGSGADVTTWHYDSYRSGLNPNETTLTPANVTSGFGKLFSYVVDGYAYAEPLLVSNVTINGTHHNVLYVATENDSIYAFDADNYGSGAPLWKTSLMQPGETLISSGTISPQEGVTGTPVIDLSTNTLYAVSMQKAPGAAAAFRLNAIDITTGQQKPGSPVTISAAVAGTNSNSHSGTISLPSSCIQRTGLLLANGNVYTGFGSCFSGWLLAYDAKTLSQVGVFNASPNIDGEGTYGGAGGVWMGSGGPVADSSGNIYISTGNGPWNPTKGSYSDSMLKFNSTLQLVDYFTPQDYDYMNCQDSDLASGGVMMLPGSGQIVGGGKMGKLYLVNTANMGHEATNDTGVTQELFVEYGLISPYQSADCTDTSGTHSTMINSYEIFGTAAYFNGSIYLGVTPTSPTAPAVVRRFEYSGGQLLPQEYSSPNIQQNTRGTTPFISANGTSDGILWMIDEGQPIGTSAPTKATLRAYDAQNLSNQLYSSSANSADVPGYGIKFSSPVVANGKVYISTGHGTTANPQGEIDVYGLK